MCLNLMTNKKYKPIINKIKPTKHLKNIYIYICPNFNKHFFLSFYEFGKINTVELSSFFLFFQNYGHMVRNCGRVLDIYEV